MITVESRSVQALLTAATQGSLHLPHIQRPFVWEVGRMSEFLQSLLLGRPGPSFLIWETLEAVPRLPFKIDHDRTKLPFQRYADGGVAVIGQKHLVLDGQQRITTLLMAFYGSYCDELGRVLLLYVRGDAAEQGWGERRRAGDVLRWEHPSWSKHGWIPMRDVVRAVSISAAEGARVIAAGTGVQEAIAAETAGAINRARQAVVAVQTLKNDPSTGTTVTIHDALSAFIAINKPSAEVGGDALRWARFSAADLTLDRLAGELTVDLRKSRALDLKGVDPTWVLKTFVLCVPTNTVRPARLENLDPMDIQNWTQEHWNRYSTAWDRLLKAVDQAEVIKRLSVGSLQKKKKTDEASIQTLLLYFFHNDPSLTKDLIKSLTAFVVLSRFRRSELARRKNLVLKVVSRSITPPVTFPYREIRAAMFHNAVDVPIKVSDLGRDRERQSTSLAIFQGWTPGADLEIEHLYPRSRMNRDLQLRAEDGDHIGNLWLYNRVDHGLKLDCEPQAWLERCPGAIPELKTALHVLPYANDPAGTLTRDAKVYRDLTDKRGEAILKRVLEHTEIGE